MVDDAEPAAARPASFFDTLRGAVLASVPALSALVFVIVAVKVFRASRMETTTTVAIVSSADAVALLKGVVLTLLPGFLAGLTAISIWWWADRLPPKAGPGMARNDAADALRCPQAVFAWSMIVVAFFTVWWPVFYLLFVPSLVAVVVVGVRLVPGAGDGTRRRAQIAAGVVLVAIAALIVAKVLSGFGWPGAVAGAILLASVGGAVVLGLRPPRRPIPLRGPLRIFGLVAAAVFVGILTLEPSVWLPLREITVKGRQALVVHGTPKSAFGAYVLSRDDKTVSLLLDEPRAVVEVAPSRLEPEMPLCVPPESAWRFLTLRASQVLGLDVDPHSPYPVCKGMGRTRF